MPPDPSSSAAGLDVTEREGVGKVAHAVRGLLWWWWRVPAADLGARFEPDAIGLSVHTDS